MVTFPQFNIEPHPNCAYDFLQINDGPTAASYAIGRYCGSNAPNNGQPINSTHHQLYFWFRSDVSVASDGFTVQWTSAMPGAYWAKTKLIIQLTLVCSNSKGLPKYSEGLVVQTIHIFEIYF